MYVNIHHGQGSIVVSICDTNLLGMKFKEGDLVLYVSPHFYKGEDKTPQEILLLFKAYQNFNFVGSETIALALQANIIEEDQVVVIQGVPHAQSLLL